MPGRPRTAAGRRLDTSRPDTSTSSVGDIPRQTFFADHEEDDFDEADEEYASDEEDRDVFAFERPKTAAVKNTTTAQDAELSRPADSLRDPASLLNVARLYTSKSRAVTTAASDESSAFGFQVPNRRDEVERDGKVTPVSTLNHLSYQSEDGTQQGLLPNPNTAPFTPQAESWGTQRPSVVSATLVGKPSTAQTKHSQILSDSAIDSPPPTADWDTFRFEPRLDKVAEDEIEMSAFRRRPTTRHSWNISELRGATTIPDGITTKGDGLGGLHPKLANDDAGSSRGGAGGMDDLEEDSPYPEVRASVSNIDDPDMPGTCL